MNLDASSRELCDLMLAANRSGADALLGRLLAENLTSAQILTEVLDPALVAVGHRWENQEISMAQAFVGARIAEDFLSACLPKSPEQAPPVVKGVVVIGNIEDDFHSLGRRMVASFLRASGWSVHDLGNDVVAETFVDRALETGACIIAASAMMHTTALNIRKVRDLIDRRGLGDQLKLAAGGAVFNWRPALVEEVGADGTATNAALVDGLFERLKAKSTEAGQP